ncbi:helical backbone metal receptor [Sciscionella sediminilitoris]|uniref:helical backbone metal receptor n=1 Tax=Sciscionella sediminilitoris TaxID=1445613 RepID=UPI0004DFCDE8|nr:helical backbone metal receptor [Sciscionella sp. SE31]
MSRRARIDDLGAAVLLPGSPARVVSLVPSLTEAVEVSLPGLLAGATDYCTHPEGLAVPRVGGSKYPVLDRVLELEPDLVLANAEENRPQEVRALRDNGIPVWVTEAAGTVPAALASLRRMFTEAFAAPVPDWLERAEQVWEHGDPVRARAVIPVWRRPWVVLGSATFAGDVLLRLGIANVYARAEQRYPRPGLEELRASGAELVVLPDEPYAFTAEDGPECFPGLPCVLVSGRHLTWCGPSLLEAHELLREQLSSPL